MEASDDREAFIRKRTFHKCLQGNILRCSAFKIHPTVSLSISNQNFNWMKSPLGGLFCGKVAALHHGYKRTLTNDYWVILLFAWKTLLYLMWLLATDRTIWWHVCFLRLHDDTQENAGSSFKTRFILTVFLFRISLRSSWEKKEVEARLFCRKVAALYHGYERTLTTDYFVILLFEWMIFIIFNVTYGYR